MIFLKVTKEKKDVFFQLSGIGEVAMGVYVWQV